MTRIARASGSIDFILTYFDDFLWKVSDEKFWDEHSTISYSQVLYHQPTI